MKEDGGVDENLTLDFNDRKLGRDKDYMHRMPPGIPLPPRLQSIQDICLRICIVVSSVQPVVDRADGKGDEYGD